MDGALLSRVGGGVVAQVRVVSEDAVGVAGQPSDLPYTAAMSEAAASIQGYRCEQCSVWRECQWLFHVVIS